MWADKAARMLEFASGGAKLCMPEIEYASLSKPNQRNGDVRKP